MRKRAMSVLLAAAMITGTMTGTAVMVKADDEPVTLTVLAGQSTTDAGIEDMIDEALAEKYPNITLEWECVDWGNDFQPKMQQYMQSGLPDIMIGKAQDVSTYAPQGVLGEIDSTYLDRGLDAARENVTIDGKHMAWFTMLCIRVFIITRLCLKKTDGKSQKHLMICRRSLMTVRKKELLRSPAIW